MKRIKLWILILCIILPITTYAKAETKDEIIEVIQNIENVQVDDDIKIINTMVKDEIITFTIEEAGVETKEFLNYLLDDNNLLFYGGYTSTYIETNQESGNSKLVIDEIKDNKLGFYLYSILENLSSCPYDIETYYNESTIKKKLEELSLEEYQEKVSINNTSPFNWMDNHNTFGLVVYPEATSDNNADLKIYYKYNLKSNYSIRKEEGKEEETITNPNTRNYNVIVTVMLLSVICVGFYTYLDIFKKVEE